MYGLINTYVKQQTPFFRPATGLTGAHVDTRVNAGLTSAMDAGELAITARMARLTLSEEEKGKLGAAVEQMLAYFSHMKEIDVRDLVPTTHALLRENRLREDRESDDSPLQGGSVPHITDTLLGNAPEREERFIVIPNVL
jgi:aspartyl-tRNA(Asn)/glutamyl-tRNA(Gln) amidotransferase subunit C